MPSGRCTTSKFRHSAKAALPMLVTEFGMVIFFISSQRKNAESPMVVTPSRMVTDSKIQLPNADPPMVFTLPGMVTDVKLIQWSNADLPMLVTE